MTMSPSTIRSSARCYALLLFLTIRIYQNAALDIKQQLQQQPVSSSSAKLSFNNRRSISPPLLGDLDNDGNLLHSDFYSDSRPPPSIVRLVCDYSISLRRSSPTLFFGSALSLFLFFLWQLPSSPPKTLAHGTSLLLQRHFVCNRSNVCGSKRLHVLFTSAFSHASFRHLVLNMVAFLTLGPSVQRTLHMVVSSYPAKTKPAWTVSDATTLGLFVISAAIVSSLVFLVLDSIIGAGNGSCIGLSGVTCALLAMDSLVHPSKEFRLMIAGFFPVILPAQYVLAGMLTWSVLGLLLEVMAGKTSGVAHGAHLGGVLWGCFVHELWQRGEIHRMIGASRWASYSTSPRRRGK